MKKRLTIIVICILNSVFAQTEQKPIPAKYLGNYIATAETEATATGMASITYNFILSKNKVELKTVTYHEPIRCNGIYRADEIDNVLELYYTGEEQTCSLPETKFYIKRHKDKLYVKGLGGEGSSTIWYELKGK